jgi:Skp family chaperone for outer membrane proteins
MVMRNETLWRWSLVGALVLLGGAILTQSIAPANATLYQSQAKPVAVVDLEKLIDMLDEREKREGDLQALGSRLEQSVNSLQTRLEEKMDEREVASESRRAALFEEIVRLQTNLQAEEEYATRIAGELLTRLKIDLYDKVLRSVKSYAESAGYDLVISDDSAGELPRNSGLQSLEVAMMSRKVLFSRDTVDITEAVANRMNADYSASAGNR